ncbi:MAG: ATP-dependent Clp protease proteolytic subunit [Clostridiales bacterium]|nr:ATP-dependent Clp protease proteolytic subunit [Clostridiales bacterium]
MIKKIIVFILLLVVLMPVANATNKSGDIYVIPVDGEIGPAVYQFLSDQIAIATENEAAAIIFGIDTYGGRIDSAISISELITGIDIPTIAFVNTKAESAGVLITISAETIAMAPHSTIGSAEPIPNNEKILSFWTSKLRSVARERGIDPEIVAAMADKSISIENVVDYKRLLNLGTREAEELGLADIVATDYYDLIEQLDIEFNKVVHVAVSFRVLVAQILSSAILVPLLLSLGFIGIMVEIFTPGFGLGGTLSIVSFSLFFAGSILAGHATYAVLIIFAAGILLLFVEALVPGFGIAGIGGIICLIGSIFMASSSVATAVVSLIIAMVFSVIALVLLLKFGPKTKFLDKIVLRASEKGYIAAAKDYSVLLNKEGIVKSYLRPAGKVEIEGAVYDVIADGDFIEKGKEIKVIKVEGRKIVVTKTN